MKHHDDYFTLGHKFATYVVAVVLVGGAVPFWNMMDGMRSDIVGLKVVINSAEAARKEKDQAQDERITDNGRRLTFLENRFFGKTVP